MFRFFRSPVCPIGIDIDDDRIKLVQLDRNGKTISLIAGGSKDKPAEIEAGSSDWQLWVIETIRELTANGEFKGKDVIASLPASEVFIDHLKMPKAENDKLADVLISQIKQKLTFGAKQAVIKYVTSEQDNVLVMVTEKEKINRHLAVYEQLNLQVKSIGVWPMALTKTYTSFFGRRKTDIDAVVLLVDIEPNYSNIVICRHLNLLFARSIPIGTSRLEDDKAVQTFVLELTGCRRHFDAMYKEATIERMIFMNGSGASVTTAGAYATIARKMEMPAQMGDCMAAVEMPSTYESGIDRRGCNFSWATTFGLSLL